MISPETEERIFTISDVKKFYAQNRLRFRKWAYIGAILSICYTTIRIAPQYLAEGSFKEEAEGEKGGSENVLKTLLGASNNSQPQAAGLMKSFQVLKPLVERMGLQASVPRSEWIVTKVVRRLTENWKIELGREIADPDSFVFEDVIYLGEKNLHYYLRFTENDRFILYLPDRKREVCQGALGQSVLTPDAQFTLIKTPKAVKKGTFYPVQITPWVSAVKAVRNDLNVSSDVKNPTLLKLSYKSRDRYFAAMLINELMTQYQLYLKRDHDQLIQAQISYLDQKQGQIYDKISDLFKEHVAYQKRNLEEKGCFSLKDESENMIRPFHELNNKITKIEMDLDRIDQVEKEGKVNSSVCGMTPQFEKIFAKMVELKQQRDLLELSIDHQSLDNTKWAQREELKEIRQKKGAIDKFIDEVDRGQLISCFGLDQGLSTMANRLQGAEEREDLAEYLERYSRLLSMREKIYQERFFSGEGPSELDGIDVATARTLLVQYNSKLDQAEALAAHYRKFKHEMEKSDFEVGSLSAILKDPFSQKLISDATQTILKLKDEKNHSLKEGERWKNEISVQKKILSDHLEQLYHIEELNASLIRAKMNQLRQISLDCINQEISVLNEQASDQMKTLRQSLLQEKNLLEKKREEIRKQSIDLPEKWLMEKWLQLKSEMEIGMMKSMTQLIESKTIGHHLHHVQSKPVDIAIVPTVPISPFIFRKAVAGALLFAIGAFLILLMRQILRGFPTSVEKLQALGYPLLGSISAFCDGPAVEIPNGPDLELLRKLSLFAEGGKVIGLIGGKGPDYSFALCENLARMSLKSIVLRCDFLSKFSQDETPGLLQIWKGETAELPIRRGKGFDYIACGGYSPFGTEIIQSSSFEKLIVTLKKEYDTIFLLHRTPIDSAESRAALRLCDKVVVTVSGEQTEELTPFVHWGYHDKSNRLTFIHY